MKNIAFVLFFVLSMLGLQSSVHASPLADMKMLYVDNRDGTYTYFFIIKNLDQPIGTEFSTPPNHTIFNRQSQSMVPAGGKNLSEDENIVLFGIDTQSDDVTITSVTNARTAFHGTAENGFTDTDADGVFNRVIGWHLPFDGFSLSDTIPTEKTAGIFSFTLNKEINHFVYWIGGSDDANIWNVGNVMLEDNYGIYDASIGEYLATFMTRKVRAIKINNRNKVKDLNF